MPNPPARPRRKITYEEYASWPDDGRRYEILDGEAREMSAPGPDHQEVVFRLWKAIDGFLLGSRTGKAYGAPIDVVPEEHWVVQPDVLAVRRENLHIVGRKAVVGVPDLVVEVLSPGTESRDRGVKRDLYGCVGVRELWLVDVDQRVLWQFEIRTGALREVGVHRGSDRFESRAFPGLTVPLDEVWPRRLEE
jgi:Uma2 family endonuclease